MADTLGTKPLKIEELLRIAARFQQQPQDEVAAKSTAVEAGFEDLPVRPDPEQVEPLSRLQTLLQGLLSAGSVFAGGINRNVQPQNFGQNILDIRQEQVDRLNEAEALKFQDERGTALARLQDLIGQRGEAQSQANLQQARIDRSSEREQDRGARVQERAAIRAENQRDKAADIARDDARLTAAIARDDRLRTEEVEAARIARIEEGFTRAAIDGGAYGLRGDSYPRDSGGLNQYLSDIGKAQAERAKIEAENEVDRDAKERAWELFDNAQMHVTGGVDALGQKIPSAVERIDAAEGNTAKRAELKKIVSMMNHAQGAPYMTPKVRAALAKMRDDLVMRYDDLMSSSDEPEDTSLGVFGRVIHNVFNPRSQVGPGDQLPRRE